MFTHKITYEDFDGNTVTDTFYFNLSHTEIVEWNVRYKGGLEAAIQRIIKTEDMKSLIEEFKYIILLSYGIKSEDGKRFIKNDQLREEFSQTAAYDKLFMSLATDADFASYFLKELVPKDIKQEIEKAETAEKTGNVMLPPNPVESPKE